MMHHHPKEREDVVRQVGGRLRGVPRGGRVYMWWWAGVSPRSVYIAQGVIDSHTLAKGLHQALSPVSTQPHLITHPSWEEGTDWDGFDDHKRVQLLLLLLPM